MWCRQHFVQKLEYLGWDLTKRLPDCPGRQPAIRRSERCAWCHILSNTAPNRGARCPFLSGRKFFVCQKNKTERASSTSWANSACRGFAKKTCRGTSAHADLHRSQASCLQATSPRASLDAADCAKPPLLSAKPWPYARNGGLNACCTAAIAAYPTDIENTCPGSCASHWRPRVVCTAWKSRHCTGSFPSPRRFNRFHWVTVTPGVWYLNSALLFLSNFLV